MKKYFIALFIFLLTGKSDSFTQEQNYEEYTSSEYVDTDTQTTANEAIVLETAETIPPTPSVTTSSAWVSVANEYITIALETNTGRYLVYDVKANYPEPTDNIKIPATSQLQVTEPTPESLSKMSVILGKNKSALNFTTLQIDGQNIIFGSTRGRWLAPPSVTADSIIYGWKIGDLEIIQTLKISENIDTLFKDAVTVTYDVINTVSDKFFNVSARINLDPSVNEGLDVPFFLVDKAVVYQEYEALSSILPDYWMTADPIGTISPLSLKGFLRGQNIITPDRFYLTTTDRVLNSPWDISINTNNRLSQKDTAIVMFYENKEINPDSTVTISSFQISRPALMETFQNNGLEARAGSFTTKTTSPMLIDIWLKNTTNDVFDDVDLTLSVPAWINITDSASKRIFNVGDRPIPVSWRITSKENIGRPADVKVQIIGRQNGVNISQFEVPITVNLVPDFRKNNVSELKKTIASSLSNTESTPTSIPSQTLQKPTGKSIPNITTASFLDDDTYGSTLAELDKIYRQLKNIESPESQEIVKLIETEKQILWEIRQAEKDLGNVNRQYEVLLEVYKQLYQDPSKIDRDYANIQKLQQSLDKREARLKSQESTFTK